MEKTRKLVILGDSAFAEIAYEYFTHDSSYEVVAFSVEQTYLKRDRLFGLPVVPFETLEEQFAPENHDFFAAITYGQLNRLRTRLFQAAKSRGYRPASYISSHAFVWRNVEVGEHCFVFENNVVQPFVKIGDNVVLWSGNHIGHHSVIGENCFIASHAVVSGFVTMGANCFVGVNTTFSNNVSIGKDCLFGAGAVVARDVPEDKVVKGEAGEPTGSARRLNRVKE
ncbi:acetyltransferase [Paraburkholderia hospita]|uniref:acetyltransferase n=1 Tax=Paraburkholderia hospita TaxID=169430 RepID=UPI003ECF8A20